VADGEVLDADARRDLVLQHAVTDGGKDGEEDDL